MFFVPRHDPFTYKIVSDNSESMRARIIIPFTLKMA